MGSAPLTEPLLLKRSGSNVHKRYGHAPPIRESESLAPPPPVCGCRHPLIRWVDSVVLYGRCGGRRWTRGFPSSRRVSRHVGSAPAQPCATIISFEAYRSQMSRMTACSNQRCAHEAVLDSGDHSLGLALHVITTEEWCAFSAMGNGPLSTESRASAPVRSGALPTLLTAVRRMGRSEPQLANMSSAAHLCTPLGAHQAE